MNLPESITDLYIVEALIHRSDRTETYRLRGKNDGKPYLLKVRNHTEKNITDTEVTTLEKLRTHKLQTPHVALRQDTDTHCYLIRDYIEGVTLETYAENVGFIREEDLLRIGIAILRELQILHDLPEPVIHRDIKPKNILLSNPDIFHKATFSETHPPLVVIIDYDTARTYKETATNDTQFLGTKETAAPEQYGFAQSDVRTDIFGVGKTLIWLATGTYEATELNIRNYSPQLRSLLRACVSLDKDDRPASALAMIHRIEKILRKNRRHDRLVKLLPGVRIYDGSYLEASDSAPHKRRVLWAGATLVIAIIIGIGGFLLGYHSNKTTVKNAPVPVAASGSSVLSLGQNAPDAAWDPAQTPPPTHAPGEKVDFGKSKSLELAVRTALGVDKKTEITLRYMRSGLPPPHPQVIG